MIDVTMVDGVIHVRPVGSLDREMIDTITRLLVSARAAGTEPVLDVSGLAAEDQRRAVELTSVTPARVA